MPSTEAGRRLLDDEMHQRLLLAIGEKADTTEEDIAAAIDAIEAEAALNQHLDECEGRCMCGAREHQGECHFGWHKDGCPDAPKVNMDDYMAGYRQGQADGVNAETLAAALHALAEDVRGGCDHSMFDIHGYGRWGYEKSCVLDAECVLAALRGDTDA